MECYSTTCFKSLTMSKLSFFLPLFLFLGFSSCQTDSSRSPSTSVPPKTADTLSAKYQGGQQPLTPQDPFVKKYQGKIGGEHPIQMHLINWGDGFLSGYYFYTQTGKKIELQGEMHLNEVVTLQAYLGDKAIDKFVFPFTDLRNIKGEWSSPGKKNLSFELSEIPVADKDKWSGNWYLNETWDGGQLLIGEVADDSLYFALSFTRSSHIGEVDGKAWVQGDSAIFNQALDYGGAADQPCRLIFLLHPDHIQIRQESETSACGFGMRAYADGDYYNRYLEKEASLPFGEKEVFVSKAQHDQFRQWIGDEAYLEIAHSMQIIESNAYQNKQENIEGVFSSGVVLGLYGISEAAVLHDGKSAFWAAYIQAANDDTSQSVIRYFTNQKNWKKKLPKAFADWRQPFSDYKVVYEN